MPQRAQDTFTRTIASGWGTGEAGAWSDGLTGTGSAASVTGSAGRLELTGTAANSVYEKLAGFSILDAIYRATFTISALPPAGSPANAAAFGLLARITGGTVILPTGAYEASVEPSSDGSCNVKIVRRDAAGAFVLIQNVVKPAGTLVAGGTYTFEFECKAAAPTLLRARLVAGAYPPIGAWDNTVADFNGPQVAGSPGARFGKVAIPTATTMRVDIAFWDVRDPREFARDLFARDTASGSYGFADIGNAWEAFPNAGATYQCLSSGGGIARTVATGVSGGTIMVARLPNSAPSLDTCIATAFRFQVRSANMTPTSLTLFARTQAGAGISIAQTGYALVINISPNGAITAQLGYCNVAGSALTMITDVMPIAPIGAYTELQMYRAEFELYGANPTYLRFRLFPADGVSVTDPDPSDGWYEAVDSLGPQIAGGASWRFTRTAPAVSVGQILDLGDWYRSGVMVPWHQVTLKAPPAGLTYTLTRIDPPAPPLDGGDAQSYVWAFGDGTPDVTVPGTGATTPTNNTTGPIDHIYPGFGVYRSRLTQTVRWGSVTPPSNYRRFHDELVTVAYDPDTVGPPRPIVTIDGRDVCDVIHEATWQRGGDTWTDGLVGSTATLSLRGRLDWIDMGQVIGIVIPDAAGGVPLWNGYVDQVAIHKDRFTGNDTTQVIAIDVASWLGRFHVEPGTALLQHALPARLNELTPATKIRYRPKWGSLGDSSPRWVQLKALAYKADKLAGKTYLDLIRDACQASIVYAYVAGNGDIVHGPWDAPDWVYVSDTPYVDLDAALDCPSDVDWDRRNLAGSVNRWTVGSGDKIDAVKMTYVDLYGEQAYTVDAGVLVDEATLPYLPFWNHMMLPKRLPVASVPVTDRAQKVLSVSPLDVVRWETKLYSCMGVKHRVDRDTWRVDLMLDRSTWDTFGGVPGQMPT